MTVVGPQRNPRPNKATAVLACLVLLERATAGEIADLLDCTTQLAGHYLRQHRARGLVRSYRVQDRDRPKTTWAVYVPTPAGRKELASHRNGTAPGYPAPPCAPS